METSSSRPSGMLDFFFSTELLDSAPRKTVSGTAFFLFNERFPLVEHK